MLFIDGDHREHAARKDFRRWQPHLFRDAVICFDDYAPSHPGVPAAVAGLVKRHILYEPDVRGRLAITGLVPPKEREQIGRASCRGSEAKGKCGGVVKENIKLDTDKDVL